MTTKEFIEVLKDLDPLGTEKIFIDEKGCWMPPQCVSLSELKASGDFEKIGIVIEPAPYWSKYDGPLV